MVRLEVVKLRSQLGEIICFNSYMVRLEEPIISATNRGLRVSIPIWCDWKKSFDPVERRLDLFQFLYGAIGRRLAKQLVLLIFVSIPIWCDWKYLHPFGLEPLELFQFLYGAIGSICIRLDLSR